MNKYVMAGRVGVCSNFFIRDGVHAFFFEPRRFHAVPR